ncbi:MAG: response regulator [Sedimentisphaerales bacterium]|nr:response regulator [Sedimentisphaerales bacterium]
MQEAKILIIDDDPDISEAMTVVLESKNYQVSIARNSREGMDRIQDDKPDLIILDVMMDTPQEGFTMGRQLQENPETKDIPVLMVTAVKEKTGLDFKAEAGDDTWLPVDDFIDKPVKPQVLLEKVAKLLSKSK